jgi:hypothetical protein
MHQSRHQDYDEPELLEDEAGHGGRVHGRFEISSLVEETIPIHAEPLLHVHDLSFT